ncbi:MAG: hypothetical protein ABI091_12770 [Ferruginibacter sp.]
MPKYRIHLKLEAKPLLEYVVFDAMNDIEFVYRHYHQRVISKNGSGRVEYFDLVMIAEASLLYTADRKEVFNPENNFGLNEVVAKYAKKKKEKRGYSSGITLGERNK